MLDAIPKAERSKLFHAFDHHFTQHVVLPQNKFIGVNITHPNFVIEEQAGCWSYGTIKTNEA